MRQYLFTERAHLMCPNMNFGLVFTVKEKTDKEKIVQSFLKMADAHPFLKAYLGYEADTRRYFYDIQKNSQVEIQVYEEKVTGINDKNVMETYEKLVSRDWNLYEEGMLKTAVWPLTDEKEGSCFLFVFHHLLADGKGALGFVQEFAGLYVRGTEPVPAREVLISSKEDFPKGSRLPFMSKMIIGNANKNWGKEKHRLSYEEYRKFADQFLKERKVVRSVTETDGEKMAEIQKICEENQISVSDYMMAKMYIEDETNKIVLDCDLRSQLPCYVPGAMGNYSTAFSIVLKKWSTDFTEMARNVHDLVQKGLATPAILFLILQCYARMNPELLDAAAISALGEFHSEAGYFAGTHLFSYRKPEGYSINNLGSMESDVIADALFIPPASPAMRKIQGILTVNGKMNICSAEQEI